MADFNDTDLFRDNEIEEKTLDDLQPVSDYSEKEGSSVKGKMDRALEKAEKEAISTEPKKDVVSTVLAAKAGIDPESKSEDSDFNSIATGSDTVQAAREQNNNPDVMSKIEEATEAKGRSLLDDEESFNKAMSEVDKGDNYQKTMIALDKILENEDDKLIAEMADAQKAKAFSGLVVAGLNVLAQLFAAQRGIEFKARGLHQKELKEAYEEKLDLIKMKRKKLTSKITSAKQLVDTVYRQRKSTEYRQDTLAEREERRKAAAQTKEQERLIRQTADAENYDRALKREEDRFVDRFNKAKESDKIEILKGIGYKEDKINEILGKKSFLGFDMLWPDGDENAEMIRSIARERALSYIKKPTSLYSPTMTDQQPVTQTQQQSTPQKGDTRIYKGVTYTFDGQSWKK